MYFLDLGGDPGGGLARRKSWCGCKDGEVTVAPDRRHPPARRHAPRRTPRSEAELLADPKECAEHLMLIDLGRNDVGRVAQPSAP